MTAVIPLSGFARALAQREADEFVQEVDGVSAIVIASVDGFEIVSSQSPTSAFEASRIAAMASSIAAISAVVSQEASLGNSRSVTIDTDDGFAVVYSVPRDDVELVINIIADRTAVLGQVAYRAAQFARNLKEA